ncbi:MAG: PEP-CTERM sorting domain-containing protein [Candidatus Competibacteraceae bacterium]
MFSYSCFRRRLAAAALCTGVFIAQTVSAGSILDFDGVAPGTPANQAIGSAAGLVSFANAVYAPRLDSDGDPIPGSERWTVDPDSATPPVVVDDPSIYFYGSAPSGSNALNALWQPILLQFMEPVRLLAFAVTLDNSSKGNLFPVPLLFLDTTGTVLASMDIDQTISGLIFTTGPVAGAVGSILLPAGAFYDNIDVTVPEPTTWGLLAGGLAVLSGVIRRRFLRCPVTTG